MLLKSLNTKPWPQNTFMQVSYSMFVLTHLLQILFFSFLFLSCYSPSCQFSPYPNLKMISVPSSLVFSPDHYPMYLKGLFFIHASEFSPFLGKETCELHPYSYPVDIMIDATFSNLATNHFFIVDTMHPYVHSSVI